jgi:uncharacterized protein (TIGR02246 family)
VAARRDLDEARVRAIENAYDRAWCAGDLDALVECFAHDAVLVNPRGQVAVGHRAIREALGSFLTREASDSRHLSTIDRIAFVSDDVAIVDGHARIESRFDTLRIDHPFTDVVVRAEGGWVIAHVRAYVFAERT